MDTRCKITPHREIGHFAFIVPLGGHRNAANIGKKCHVTMQGEPIHLFVKDESLDIHYGCATIVGKRDSGQPRVFIVGSLQKNYKGEVCYRVYGTDEKGEQDDTFGRLALFEEVVFI